MGSGYRGARLECRRTVLGLQNEPRKKALDVFAGLMNFRLAQGATGTFINNSVEFSDGLGLLEVLLNVQCFCGFLSLKLEGSGFAFHKTLTVNLNRLPAGFRPDSTRSDENAHRNQPRPGRRNAFTNSHC